MFFVQCSDLVVLQCSFQFFDADTKLHTQFGTDRGTVLWPELGSKCCALGGPDLFSVQRSVQRSVLSALQCSFQFFDGNNKLQSQCGSDRGGTVLWPEVGSQ